MSRTLIPGLLPYIQDGKVICPVIFIYSKIILHLVLWILCPVGLPVKRVR